MNTTKRGDRQRVIYRLELGCGHTAFALVGEAHVVGQRRPCAACACTPRIMGSVASIFSVPRAGSRTPSRHRKVT